MDSNSNTANGSSFNISKDALGNHSLAEFDRNSEVHLSDLKLKKDTSVTINKGISKKISRVSD